MGLHIHVGVHKTATTHLQRCISAVEPQLMDRDIMFLGPQTLRANPVDLRSLLDGDRSATERWRKTRNVLRGVLADHRDMLISEELLLGGLDPERFLGRDGQIYTTAEERLANLFRLLGARDATLFLALRSPADFLTSVFAEQMRFGGELNIAEYIGDFDPVLLDWPGLVTRLLKAGATRVVCWRYEDLAAVRSKILRRRLGQRIAGLIPDLRPVRLGLSPAAYRMIEENSASVAVEERQVLVARAMKAHPKRRNDPPLRIFDPAIHALCEQGYDRDCARIAAMPGVEFLRPADTA